MSSQTEQIAGAASTDTFLVRDCALIAIATGIKAITLKELRDGLAESDLGSVYYHFWGGLLQPRFEEREYNNDFAGWARHGLHDSVLAERLAVVDPSDFDNLEGLRQELLEIIEQHLDEREQLKWLAASQQFEFIQSQIVIFDTRYRAESLEELAQLIPHLSPSSIFYHFIDARRRSAERRDDFSTWLLSFNKEEYEALCHQLADIDPYFGSLTELRDQLTKTFANFLGG